MSAYPPPTQNLPIYNSIEFIEENYPLTIQDAKAFFLEYPTAQGAETLSSISVNGTSVFNDVATVNDTLVIGQPTPALNALEITNDTPGTSITATSKTAQGTAGLLHIQGSADLGDYNPITLAGDSVITSSIFGVDDTGGLCLTQNSATASGVRLANGEVEVYGDLEIKTNTGITFFDGTTQSTASSTYVVPTLSDVLVAGNSASATSINMNSQNITALTTLSFQDGTNQTTAFVGQSFNQQTGTSDTPGYDASTDLTTYNFQSGQYPTTYESFEWIFTTPYASSTSRVRSGLGSSPPLAVGVIEPTNSFITMTGAGSRQAYTATSSNMITYCAGFQQNYSITANGIAVEMTSATILGGTLQDIAFYSNDLTENNGTCPPTANGIAGMVRIRVGGDTTGLGVATIKFIETS